MSVQNDNNNENIIYASLPERFMAVLIDYLVICSSLFVVIIMTNNYFEGVVHLKFWHVLSIEWLYFGSQHSSTKRATLGMRAMRLEIMTMELQQLTLTTASLRYGVSILSSLILWLGHWMMLTNDLRQALHDKIAGTLVIKKHPLS